MIKLIKKIYQQNWNFADTVYLYIWTSVIMTVIGFFYRCFVDIVFSFRLK